MEDRSELKQRWIKIFQEGVEEDTWGHVLEAISLYDKLAQSLSKHMALPTVAQTEHVVLSKLHGCVLLRTKALRDPTFRGMPLEQFKGLRGVLEQLYSAPMVVFPFDVESIRTDARAVFASAESVASTASGIVSGTPRGKVILSGGAAASGLAPVGTPTATAAAGASAIATGSGVSGAIGAASAQRGTLLPPPPPFMAGETALIIRVEKIGLKDAQSNYVDPFITVSVMEGPRCLELSQDLPVTSRRMPMYILFDNTVHIQTPLEQLPATAAIFFEFKHYKARENKISTRCWSFMEKDEIKEGPIALEIYKKPTDLTRKTTRLLSVKPLFLHLHLTLVRF